MVSNGHTKDQDGIVKGFDLEKTDLSKVMANTISSRFAGMEVDPSTKTFLDFLLYQFVPYAADQVEKHGVKFLRDTALSSGLVKDETKALHIGKKYAPALAMATVLAEPIISLGASGYDTTNRLNELRKALSPVSKSNHKFASVEAIFGSNNEVVQNARNKIYGQLYADVGGVLARSIVAIPALMTVRSRTKERLKAQSEEVDLELAMKDPKALEAYLQKNVQSTSSVHNSVEEVKVKHIKKMREDYVKEFETWEKGTDGKKAYEEILKRIKEDSDYAQKLGLSGVLNRSVETTIDNRKVTSKVSDLLASKRTSNRSLSREHGEIDRAVKKQLKYRFVEDAKQGQALNDQWIEPKLDRWGRSAETEKKSGFRTLEEGAEKLYAEMYDRMMGKKTAAEQELKTHGGSGNSPDIFNQGIMGLASIAGNQLDKLLVGNKRKELDKPVALDLIMHMKKVLEDSPGAASIPNFGDRSGDGSYLKYVHEIFQQHQIDCHKSEIGERYFDKLTHARFSDEAVFQMKDEELSAYEVAVKHIARALKEGQMDAAALINLVGQRKIVQKDGKHFGPKGSDGKAQGVIDEINKQCACISAHKELSAEQLSELMSRFVFSEEELKAGFTTNGAFQGEDKPFMFALLESQVKDIETMKKITGLSEAQMETLRKQATSQFSKHFDTVIATIAEMSNEELANLSKHEITVDEIKMIRDAAASMKQSGKHAVDVVSGEAKEHLEAAVANVVMAEHKEDAPSWRERVQKRIKESVANALATTPIESKLDQLKAERGGEEYGSARDRLQAEREMESNSTRLPS